jgi:hypothetical protein
MDSTSASSSGKDFLNDSLSVLEPSESVLEPSEKAHNERPRARAGRIRNPAPSPRDLSFAGAPSHSGLVERGPLLASDARPVLADDGSIEKLQSLIHLLRDECRVRRLPRATPLQPIPGLRAASANSAAPNRLAIHLDERRPTMLHRPRRSLPKQMALLLGGVIVVVLCVGVAATSWRPAMDVSEATSRLPDETRPVRLASLPQAGLLPTEFNGSRTTSAASDSPRMTMHTDDKPTGSGTEAGLPQTFPASEFSTAPGTTSSISRLDSVHQISSESSTTAVLNLQDAKSEIQAEGQPPALTCYPSAAAVMRDHPDGWPSWTSRAPGHEGTRCWHATTHAPVHERRTELPPKRQRVGTLDNLRPPVRQAD